MTKKIGILVGREWSWPPAFIEEVNRRNEGVVAEFVKLGGTRMAEVSEYDVIIDRISHEIPYYRAFLKTAMLGGTTVINNPFWWSADDKFTGATICARLGIPHARTVALPSHSYIEGISHTESLRNLVTPIPWQEHVDYVGGFPVILKPAWGGGFKSVFKVNSLEELWGAYNQTGTECMMLQEYIAWEKYARCICIGRDQIMPIKFDANAPWPHRYFDEPDFLTPEEREQVVTNARRIVEVLGYDMNTVEFALKDGVPYAIDFTNPAPDFDINSLTQKYFDWAVNAMANFCIARAKEGRRELTHFDWSTILHGEQVTTAHAAQPAHLSRRHGTNSSTTGDASGTSKRRSSGQQAAPAATDETASTTKRRSTRQQAVPAAAEAAAPPRGRGRRKATTPAEPIPEDQIGQ